MDFICPSCNSANAKKLSLIYEEGISVVQSQTQSTGVGIGVTASGIGAGIGQAHSQSNGIQQTALSRRLSPPPRSTPSLPSIPITPGEWTMILGWVFAVVGAPILYWFDVVPSYWAAVGIGVAIVVWGMIRKRRMSPSEREAFDQRCQRIRAEREHILFFHRQSDPFEVWNRSFMCMTCGSQFDPSVSPSERERKALLQGWASGKLTPEKKRELPSKLEALKKQARDDKPPMLNKRKKRKPPQANTSAAADPAAWIARRTSGEPLDKVLQDLQEVLDQGAINAEQFAAIRKLLVS